METTHFTRHERRIARREARRQAAEMIGEVRSNGYVVTATDAKRYVRRNWRSIAASMQSQISFPWQEA